MTTRSVMPVAIAATIVLAGIAAANFAAVRDAAVPTEVANVRGEFKVTLDLTTGNGESHTDVEEGCSQIDFHPEYLVLRLKTGGRVVPIRLIRNVRWQGK